jgi:hypothetical protein
MAGDLSNEPRKLFQQQILAVSVEIDIPRS